MRRSRTDCRLAGLRNSGFCETASSSLASPIWHSAVAAPASVNVSAAVSKVVETLMGILQATV